MQGQEKKFQEWELRVGKFQENAYKLVKVRLKNTSTRLAKIRWKIHPPAGESQVEKLYGESQVETTSACRWKSGEKIDLPAVKSRLKVLKICRQISNSFSPVWLLQISTGCCKIPARCWPNFGQMIGGRIRADRDFLGKAGSGLGLEPLLSAIEKFYLVKLEKGGWIASSVDLRPYRTCTSTEADAATQSGGCAKDGGRSRG